MLRRRLTCDDGDAAAAHGRHPPRHPPWWRVRTPHGLLDSQQRGRLPRGGRDGARCGGGRGRRCYLGQRRLLQLLQAPEQAAVQLLLLWRGAGVARNVDRQLSLTTSHRRGIRWAGRGRVTTRQCHVHLAQLLARPARARPRRRVPAVAPHAHLQPHLRVTKVLHWGGAHPEIDAASQSLVSRVVTLRRRRGPCRGRFRRKCLGHRQVQ